MTNPDHQPTDHDGMQPDETEPGGWGDLALPMAILVVAIPVIAILAVLAGIIGGIAYLWMHPAIVVVCSRALAVLALLVGLGVLLTGIPGGDD